MDREPSNWAGRDLWWIFRRGIERNRALRIGLDDGRYVDAAQRFETGRLLQCQFGSRDFLPVFGKSNLAGGARHGSRCVNRRKFGRKIGRPCPTCDVALDGRDHWRDRCHHLSGARLVNVHRAKKLQIMFPRGLKEVEFIRGLKLLISCAYQVLMMSLG